MACWRRTCSCAPRAPTDGRTRSPAARYAGGTEPRASSRRLNKAVAGLALALLASACGHAKDGDTQDATAATAGRATPVSAGESGVASAANSGAAMPTGEQARCVPANEGALKARLRGEIDASIEWSAPMPQCRGAPRPGGDGVRLVYKGEVPGQGPLLVVIGIGPLREGASASNVPANLTLVREGAGRFYATQGDDKCAVDDVRQEPVFGNGHTYRLTGRGYCTQPARALTGEGVVLVSRFDVSAVVDYE